MARLTQARADRLVAVLSSPEPSGPESGAVDSSRPLGETSAQALRTRLAACSADGSLARAMSAALSAYLNRSVRCSSPVTVSEPGALWTYASPAGGVRWIVGVEEGLGLAIADAMIGGDGDRRRLSANTRAKSLMARAADRITECAARTVGLARPLPMTFESDEAMLRMSTIAASGLCALKDEFFWQLSVADADGVGIVPHADAEALVRPAIEAAAHSLAELAHTECRLAIEKNGVPAEIDAHADGVGASLGRDQETVFAVHTTPAGAHAIATAALRCDFPKTPALSPVLRSIAETLLRAALERFVETLGAGDNDVATTLPIVTSGTIGERALTLSWRLRRSDGT